VRTVVKTILFRSPTALKLNAVLPVTRTAFHMHHRQNPDAVGLLDVITAYGKTLEKCRCAGGSNGRKRFGSRRMS